MHLSALVFALVALCTSHLFGTSIVKSQGRLTISAINRL
jgi:hypothetical protein